MTENSTRERGNTAENIVAEYLAEKKYKIIKRNFHFGKFGEIDIICEYNNMLVFIEVRSRFSQNSIDPIETFSYKKRRSVMKTIEGYLYVNKITNKDCRFDFIKVDMFYDSPKITHIENAL
jgi:putative endonuclease